MHATPLYSHRLQPKNIAFAGTKRVIPMPARVANQNTGFTSSCQLAVSEEYVTNFSIPGKISLTSPIDVERKCSFCFLAGHLKINKKSVCKKISFL